MIAAMEVASVMVAARTMVAVMYDDSCTSKGWKKQQQQHLP